MVVYIGGMNKSKKETVNCDYCGKELVRLVWNYGQNRPIKQFFCNTMCKGNWQRLQREKLGFTKDWLFDQYITQGKGAYEIGREIGRDGKRVWEWLRDYGIETRHRGEAAAPYHFKKGQQARLGIRHSEETRKKMSDIAKADGRMPFKKENGPPMKGKRGAETSNWKGGVTPLRQGVYSSVEWVEAVKVVWSRDNAKCQRCGKHHNTEESRGAFHIHHIKSFMYEKTRTDPDNLVLLCRKCHLFVHSRKNTAKEFIKK